MALAGNPARPRLVSSRAEANVLPFREQSEWIEAIVRLGILGMKTLGPDLRYRSANPAFCRFVGYRQEEVAGLCVDDLAFPEDREWIQKRYQRFLAKKSPFMQFEWRFRHKKGHEVWGVANHVLVVDGSGNPAYVIGQVIDITSRKRVEDRLRLREAALRSTQVRLKALTRELFRGGEEIRRSLARELHDDLMQRLASVGYRVSSLKKDPALPPRVRKELRSLTSELQTLTRSTQDLSHRLHPRMLDEFGLVPALEAECSALSRGGRIRMDFEHCDVPKKFPADLSLCLYRIVQEAFHNITRHARARNAGLQIHADASGVHLRVSDDGRGFSRVRIKSKKGLGLISMEERARLAGGSFLISSERSGGTVIQVHIPWRRQRHEATTNHSG